jgi:hypothetical protein
MNIRYLAIVKDGLGRTVACDGEWEVRQCLKEHAEDFVIGEYGDLVDAERAVALVRQIPRR